MPFQHSLVQWCLFFGFAIASELFVQTTTSPVHDIYNDTDHDVRTFLGISFAEPLLVDLRFATPAKKDRRPQSLMHPRSVLLGPEYIQLAMATRRTGSILFCPTIPGMRTIYPKTASQSTSGHPPRSDSRKRLAMSNRLVQL
jgi:hypothetical protein